MKEVIAKAWAGIMSTFKTARISSPIGERLQAQDSQEAEPPRPTAKEARKAFRNAITNYVADGWSIEIENEFDAVLSKKGQFHWVGKLIIFLLLLLLFPPLGLFYLIVVIIKGVTAKPGRLRVWIDEDGRIQRS